MKKIIAFTLVLSVLLHTVAAQQKTFLRIYDLSGKKIIKGFFAGATDSSIFIKNKEAKKEISFDRIGSIKTKRSPGHSVFTGAAIGAICGISLGIFAHGVSSGQKAPPMSENIAGGFAFGTMAGGLVGAIISLFSRSETFIINGEPGKWEKVKAAVSKFNVLK